MCLDLCFSAANWARYAQANIKLESYGFAVEDASKAIELDASYVKVRSNRPILLLHGKE